MTPSKIKAARKAAGLTQAQAAELIGVTTRAWQYYEAGKRTISAAAWELFQLKIQPGNPGRRKEGGKP